MGSGAFEGKKLGKYRLIRLLGRGGMAEVYLAEHEMLQNRVAVKILPPELAADADMVSRFLREARAAAGLRHPHIVRIHDVGQEGGANYFAMDYVEGRSLGEVIAGAGALPEEQIVHLSRQVLSALAEAHAHGVVHRDIKPDNVTVDGRGDAVVMDFGIAKAQQATRVTMAGTFLGTVAYSSPEQARGLEVDQRSDLYSWGVVMYEMATGRAPFAGQDTTAVIYQHVHEVPRPPGELNAGVSPGLTAFILKALEKRPEDRFASAEEALVDLERLAGTGRATGPHASAGPRAEDLRQAQNARARALLSEAEALMERGQWTAAQALAEKARELDPSLEGAGEAVERAGRELAGEERALSLEARAREFEEQGAFVEAADMVAELMKVTPDKAAALEWLERLQVAQREAAEVEAGLQRGRALESAGELDLAEAVYRELAGGRGRDPRPAKALQDLADTRCAADLAGRAAQKAAKADLAGAALDYQASLDLRPDQPATRRALEEVRRRLSRGQRAAALAAQAEDLLSRGEGLGALEALREALALEPGLDRARLLLPRAEAAAHAQEVEQGRHRSEPTVVVRAPLSGAPPPPSAPDGPGIDAPPPGEPPAGAPPRASRAGLWIALLALALAGAAGGWWWSQRAPEPGPVAVLTSTTLATPTSTSTTSTTSSTTTSAPTSTTLATAKRAAIFAASSTSTTSSSTSSTSTTGVTSTTLSAETRAAAEADRGREFLARDQLDDAARAFREALALDPNHRQALAGLEEVNRRRTARQERQALDQARAAATRGEALLEADRLDEAAAAFQEALDARADLESALAGLAAVRARREALAEAARRTRVGDEVTRAVAEGRDQLSRGRLEQAEAAFRRAQERDPGSREAALGLDQVAAARMEQARRQEEARLKAQASRQEEARLKEQARKKEEARRKAEAARRAALEKVGVATPTTVPPPPPRSAKGMDNEERRQAQLAKVQGVTEFNARNFDAAVDRFAHYNRVFPDDPEGAKLLAQARKWAAASRSGSLNLDCDPPAEALVDGQVVGRTPLRGAQVAVGQRRVEARAFGGKAVSTLTVKPATTVSLSLVIKGGSLVVRSQPRAELFLEGQRCGMTPIEMGNLKVGPRRIVLRAPGYRDLEKVVEVRGDRAVQLNLELVR